MAEINFDERIAQMETDIRSLKAEQMSLNQFQAVYKRIMFGDTDTESPGLLRRISTLEKLVEASEDERKNQKTMIKGVLVGLGFTSVTGIGTLATLLSQVLGAGAVKP